MSEKKRKITRDQRLQVIGLLTVAQQQMRAVVATEAALAELLDDLPDGGHCGDAIWSEYTADTLLQKLNVTVVANVRGKASAQAKRKRGRAE